MDNNNRPREREKNVTGSANVYKRKESAGTGPVGRGKTSAGKRAAQVGGGGSIVAIIIAIIISLTNGGGNVDLGGLTDNVGGIVSNVGGGTVTGETAKKGDEIQIANVSDGRVVSNDSGIKVSTAVASGSRAKRTEILGNGKDVITFMVYMCGTDLESKSGMASSDLKEMAAASLSDNINIIVFTGGCKGWKINGISRNENQIYQVKKGKIVCLEDNMGTKAMTDPTNLTSFIQYCSKNFPANRYELIMWDHGGGSVSGYGYDEKNSSSGSMSLAGVNTALKNAGVTFDFVGFDACLMATAETALMLEPYADYLVASEETEPGIGWYYTNWLNALSQNTSMPTAELGKIIVDDFVATCAARCKGQKTTLSVIDLAEFSNTVPDKLSAFSGSISKLITNKKFNAVSSARNDTREFATSSKIDQVDLVDLALKMGTAEGKQLSEALTNAVKYNRTSTNMTQAYGVSIYFPYQRTSYVDKAVNTYNQIGMDDDYAKCIRQVANMTNSGQASTSGSASQSSLLGALLGLNKAMPVDESGDFMKEETLSDEEKAQYISENSFDISNLKWNKDGDKYIISMSDDQWDLIHFVDKCMYIDDGEGFIDLGLDNVYSWDNGKMVADTENTWIAINGQVVSYYHTDTIEDGDNYAITGYVPAKLNGTFVKLIIVYDQDNPDGYVAGYSFDYKEGETDTVAKADGALTKGDKLQFICDYYNYDGEYIDSYLLGEDMIVEDSLEVSDVSLENVNSQITYCFTDLFNQEYYTEVIK